MTVVRSRITKVTASILLGVLGYVWTAFPVPARAYSEITHQHTTRIAFDIARLVLWQQDPAHDNLAPPGSTSMWTAPAGYDPVEWEAFMQATTEAAWRFLGSYSGLPELGSCKNQGTRLHNIKSPGEGLGFHFEYLLKEQEGYKQCTQEEEKGSLAKDLDAAFPHGIAGGSALGVHAAAPDHYKDDWHVYINPMMAGGLGQLTNWLDSLTSISLGAALGPLMCIGRWFRGQSCGIQDMREFGDRANVLPEIIGAIPSPFELASFKIGWTTGMGHLMNYGPFAQNFYDDIEGYHMERSGFRGRPGIADVALSVIFDTAGLTIDPNDSNGVRNYEICNGTVWGCDHDEVLDNHPSSNRRTDGLWRSSTVGHTTFTPLDNLAYYGWQRAQNPNFPESGHNLYIRPKDIARPLHALGDIAAPHHLIGCLGWGHRPYEKMVAYYWDELQTLEAGTDSEQYEAWRDILKRAFTWRKFVLEWRASFQPADPLDIPVREMITRMGRRNYSFIHTGNELTYGDGNGRIGLTDLPSDAFPYADLVHEIGDDGGGQVELWKDTNKPEIEYLVRNATANVLSFIVSSAERFEPTFCGDGMIRSPEVCDDGNDDDGDGCSSACTVEPLWRCNTSWPSECGYNCGDSILDNGEQCDDGNDVADDGCSSACTTENGWYCNTSSPTLCHTTCGDEIRAGEEDCDHGPSGSAVCDELCQFRID